MLKNKAQKTTKIAFIWSLCFEWLYFFGADLKVINQMNDRVRVVKLLSNKR